MIIYASLNVELIIRRDIRCNGLCIIAIFAWHSATTFIEDYLTLISLYSLSFYTICNMTDCLTAMNSVMNSFEIYLANNFISSFRVIYDCSLCELDDLTIRLIVRLASEFRRKLSHRYLYTTHFPVIHCPRLDRLLVRFSALFRARAPFFCGYRRRSRLQSRAAWLIERDYFLVAIYNKPPLFVRHGSAMKNKTREWFLVSVPSSSTVKWP